MFMEAKYKKQLKFNQFHTWIERHLQKTVQSMRNGFDARSETTTGIHCRKNSAPSVRSHKSILIEATDEFWHKVVQPRGHPGPQAIDLVAAESDYMDLEVHSYRWIQNIWQSKWCNYQTWCINIYPQELILVRIIFKFSDLMPIILFYANFQWPIVNLLLMLNQNIIINYAFIRSTVNN